jgi:hypothetical protein
VVIFNRYNNPRTSSYKFSQEGSVEYERPTGVLDFDDRRANVGIKHFFHGLQHTGESIEIHHFQDHHLPFSVLRGGRYKDSSAEGQSVDQSFPSNEQYYNPQDANKDSTSNDAWKHSDDLDFGDNDGNNRPESDFRPSILPRPLTPIRKGEID